MHFKYKHIYFMAASRKMHTRLVRDFRICSEYHSQIRCLEGVPVSGLLTAKCTYHSLRDVAKMLKYICNYPLPTTRSNTVYSQFHQKVYNSFVQSIQPCTAFILRCVPVSGYPHFQIR